MEQGFIARRVRALGRPTEEYFLRKCVSCTPDKNARRGVTVVFLWKLLLVVTLAAGSFLSSTTSEAATAPRYQFLLGGNQPIRATLREAEEDLEQYLRREPISYVGPTGPTIHVFSGLLDGEHMTMFRSWSGIGYPGPGAPYVLRHYRKIWKPGIFYSGPTPVGSATACSQWPVNHWRDTQGPRSFSYLDSSGSGYGLSSDCWAYGSPRYARYQLIDYWNPDNLNEDFGYNYLIIEYSAEPKSLGCQEHSVGNPCDAATGNKYHTEADYTGPNEALRWRRHYNNYIGEDIGLGVGWTSSSHTVLHGAVNGSKSIFVRHPDGRGEYFRGGGSAWQGDADSSSRLSLAA